MAREVRIERRGARGLSDAEQQFLAGNIAAPTAAALDAYRRGPALNAASQAQQQTGLALADFGEAGTLALMELDAAATQVQQQADAALAQVEADVQAAIGEFQADQEQLQALADILVPSGATATFRDSDNLMLLGDML